jgi:RNA polymerase sigma factor (sigma-70 family)
VDLYSFDDAYLQRLEAGDPETEQHFVCYFSSLLRIKLRNKSLRNAEIEDVKQETLMRVMRAVKNREVHEPKRFGAYVNSVCNNYLKECYRNGSRNQHVDVDGIDVADGEIDLELDIIREERQQEVRAVLTRLSEKDQAILRAHFEEELDKEEMCRKFRVGRGYLRVMLFRALKSFKAHYTPPRPPRARGQAGR